MIQLLDRNEALEKNNLLASFIKYSQDKEYAPELFKPGENWVEEEQKWVELSEEECEKRNSPILEEYNAIRDNLDSIRDLDSLNDEIIITTRAEGEAHFGLIASGLQELNHKLNWNGVIFILEYPFSWMEYLDPSNSEAQGLLEWFERNGANKNFKGAVYVNRNEVESFSKLLILLIAKNPNFPVCRLAGVNSAAIGSFCKYGNTHFLIYEKGVKQGFEQAIIGTGLKEIPFGACNYKF